MAQNPDNVSPQEPDHNTLLKYARDGAALLMTGKEKTLSQAQIAKIEGHILWISSQISEEDDDNKKDGKRKTITLKGKRGENKEDNSDD